MSEVDKWLDSPVDVQARLIPRFLWVTASIDAFVGGQCILRTGGQLSLKGRQSAIFTHSGSSHTAELTWGASGLWPSFPYWLRIDGVQVSASRVRIRNWPMGFVGASMIAAVLAMILHFVHVVSRA